MNDMADNIEQFLYCANFVFLLNFLQENYSGEPRRGNSCNFLWNSKTEDSGLLQYCTS